MRAFGLSLALVGFAIVLVGSRQALVTTIPVGMEFGLFQLLPLTYWVGLGVMGAALAIALRSGTPAHFALVGVIFFATLAGTPTLYEPNPPVWDSYWHYSGSLEIGALGHIPDIPTRYARNWPGFFLYALDLSTLADLAPFALVTLNPFLTGGLAFLALFVLLRRLLEVSFAARGGSVLAGLLNVWGQYHASPQSVGLILALLLLALVWERHVRARIAAAVLGLGLVASHPTSMVLVLAILLFYAPLSLLSRLVLRRRLLHRRREGLGTPALTFGTLWVGWLFFQAVGSARDVEQVVIRRMRFILQLPEQTLNIATARAVENLYVWAPLIRLGGLVVVGLALLVALLLLVRQEGATHRVRVFLSLFFAPGLFAGIDILAFQGQIYDRAFLLFAVLAPGAILFGLARGGIKRAPRRLALVVLTVVCLAMASTLHYQAAFFLVSDRSVALSGFLQNAPSETLVIDGHYPEPIWLEGGVAPWDALGFYQIYPTPLEDLPGERTVLAVYDPTSELWYRQWRGTDIYEAYEPSGGFLHPLVYTNGQAQIYFVVPPPRGGAPAPGGTGP